MSDIVAPASLVNNKQQPVLLDHTVDFNKSLMARRFDTVFIQALYRLIKLDIELEAQSVEAHDHAPFLHVTHTHQKTDVEETLVMEDHASKPDSTKQGASKLCSSEFVNSLMNFFNNSNNPRVEDKNTSIKVTLRAQMILQVLRFFLHQFSACDISISFGVIKRNFTFFVNKVIQNSNMMISGSPNWKELFESLLSFIIFDVSNILVKAETLSSQTEEFGNLMQDYLISIINKVINKTQNAHLFATMCQLIIDIIHKCQRFRIKVDGTDQAQQRIQVKAGLILASEVLEKLMLMILS